MFDFIKNIFSTSDVPTNPNTQKGLDAISSIRDSYNLSKTEIPSVNLPKTSIETPSISRPLTTPSIPTPKPVSIPGTTYSELTGMGKPLYTPFKQTISEVTQPKIKFYEPTPYKTTPITQEPVAGQIFNYTVNRLAKPIGDAIEKDLYPAFNVGRTGENLQWYERALKGISGVGTFINIPNEALVQPIWGGAKYALQAYRTGKYDPSGLENAISATQGGLTLGDALGLDEKTTNPVIYQAVRLIDFMPSLIDVFPSIKKGKISFFSEAKLPPNEYDNLVEEGAKAFEKATGDTVSKDVKDFVKGFKNNPRELFTYAQGAAKEATKGITPESLAAREAQKAQETGFGASMAEKKRRKDLGLFVGGQTPSEIINLEPSTATLRTGRYGQNADVVAQGVKDNVTQIGEKMSPKVDLKKIDELAKAETTIISKETQNIYKKILDAVEKNPKFSEELAVLQQQQTAAIGDAVRQAGGRLTPDLIDALVRPKGFDRLIGQQLVSLKNAADGIFSAVTAKDINAIENSIGRTLTKDEIKTLEGINNLDDAAVFSDELRFSAKKLNNTTAKILQLENELKKLDDFENQWQKAKDYITKNNIDVNDPEQFADVYRQFMPANIGDWFNLIQYNSMLSAPTTFLNNLTYVTTLLKNTAGYTVQGALQQLKAKIYKGYQPEYDLGSGIRYAGGYLKGTWKALGQPTKEWFGEVLGEMKNTKSLTDTPGQIVALQGNMWDKTKGLFQRFKNANKNFGEKIASMKLVTPEEFENIRLSKPGTALGYVEDFLKIPSNALEMADTLMGIIYKQGELAALTKGVRGKQAKATQRAMRDLFKGDLTEEGAGALSNIIGGLGDFAMKGRNYKLGSNDPGAKAIRAFANFTLPFIRVPTNWLKIGLEYTPAGLINLIGAKDKTVPLAKVITGLPISIFVASKYANGEITGAMPQDKKTRDYWDENGIKPFSIKIGDTWYDYTKFNPFMTVTMMTTVGAMEAFRQKDITQDLAERTLAMTLSVYEYWSQQSFVQNMGLLQNINSSDFSMEKLNKLGYNALSRAIPYQGLMRWYARLQDGSIKDPQTFKQTFEQNLPYFKQFAPNKVDSQGNNLKDEFNIYNSFPVFGRKSQQKAGAMEGLKELRNEQFINKSKTEIQKIIDEDVKRVAGGQIPSLDKGQAPALIAGLNNIDPLNVYWLNPVGEKLETVDLSFTKYQPQNQKEMKTFENKYNKLVQEIQYNPYISQEDMNNIMNRLNVPDKNRIYPSQEEKLRWYQLSKPEEKQPKIKATPEQRKQNIEFSQLRNQLETQLPILKTQSQAQKASRVSLKKPKKPRKPTLTKVKLKNIKIGTKLAKNVKLKAQKMTAKAIPAPKVSIKKTTKTV